MSLKYEPSTEAPARYIGDRAPLVAGCAAPGTVLVTPTLEATQGRIPQMPPDYGGICMGVDLRNHRLPWEIDLRFSPGLPPGWPALPPRAPAENPRQGFFFLLLYYSRA